MLLLEVAAFWAAVTSAQRDLERPPGAVEQSPLTVVDPPELDFLKNSSMAIEFSISSTYNNGNYLMNWAKGMARPGNKRYWFTFNYNAPTNGQIHLLPNMTTCVYDVTKNANFLKLQRLSNAEPNDRTLIILQCDPNDCNEDDIGCGRTSFSWLKVLTVISCLVVIATILMCRKGSVIPAYFKTKLMKRQTVRMEPELF